MYQDQQGLPRQSYKEIIVQGGRRRGEQKKNWENNISEWISGLKFCIALKESENKIKWRERVARSMEP